MIFTIEYTDDRKRVWERHANGTWTELDWEFFMSDILGIKTVVKTFEDSAVNDAEEDAGRSEAIADLAENYGRSIENMPPNFSTSSSYSVGDYVSYEGSIYRFLTDHLAGPWNNNHVTAYI